MADLRETVEVIMTRPPTHSGMSAGRVARMRRSWGVAAVVFGLVMGGNAPAWAEPVAAGTAVVCATTPIVPPGVVAASGNPSAVYGGVPLSGSQVDAAATIVNVGLDAGISRRGITIAIATAMMSSSLNPKAKHAQQLGLFQQRSDSSSGLYTGQDRRDPIGSAKMFFEQLVKRVPGYETDARGDAELGDAVQESGDLDAISQWGGVAAALTNQFIPVVEAPAAPAEVQPVEVAPAATWLSASSGHQVAFALRAPLVAFAAPSADPTTDVEPPATTTGAPVTDPTTTADATPVGTTAGSTDTSTTATDSSESSETTGSTVDTTVTGTDADSTEVAGTESTTDPSAGSSTASTDPSATGTTDATPTGGTSGESTTSATADPTTTAEPSSTDPATTDPTTAGSTTQSTTETTAGSTSGDPATGVTTTDTTTTGPTTDPTANEPGAPAASDPAVVDGPAETADSATDPQRSPDTVTTPRSSAVSTGCAPNNNGGSTTFDPGFIVSDEVFYNSQAMSAEQIQAFLDKLGADCSSAACVKNLRVTTPDVPADQYCAAYSGGTDELASAVLARASVACGINPQVMLVTLQKEAALLTKTSVSLSSYNAAWGWHCPDTGPGGSANCDPKYAGFFNQAFGMAKQWARYRVDPGKYHYQAGETTNILWNVAETGCGGSDVTIKNTATASLYNYTPYQPNAAAIAAYPGVGDRCSAYGNRNFFFLFQKYFGVTGGGVSANIVLNGVDVTIPNVSTVAPEVRGATITAPNTAVAQGLANGFAAIGLPYVWGGGSNGGQADQGCSRGGGAKNSCGGTVGFDCSGLTAYVLTSAGFAIGTNSGSQRAGGQSVPWSAGVPGDIIGYSGHVAVYLGKINGVDYLLEAPDVGKYVQIRPVYSRNNGTGADSVLHRYWQ